MPMTGSDPLRAFALMIQINGLRASVANDRGDSEATAKLLEALLEDTSTLLSKMDGTDQAVADELAHIVATQRSSAE